MTTSTPGGFVGDPAEAFTPPAAGGCCGSAPSSGTAASSCCGTGVAQDAATSCCGEPAKAETAASSEGCCG